ncbi:sialidase family protein [Paenibacillus eucommiae]|uniref:Sialidase domain-containing protein n=1 Tax=Paenibacillus eucommiae TaxID=1355755 RepID=A0ABS4ILX8_9BACL|nr:sialidase family protein [Paenibacillus eucommiae]MBP1988572.1 hypothetical protein [Paenibacillus eucommiae]
MQKKGNVVLDLRPTPGNPRNSEGAFLNLKDGRVLLVYSRFIGGSYHDDAKACIAARVSEDQGDTWSDDEIIAVPEEYNALNIMSVSLLRMGNEDIGLFYVIRQGWHDTRLHLRRSSDEGKTWGEPVCCVPCLGYYVTNNDRVIRLKSGRLLVPAAFHKIRGNNTTDWSGFDEKGHAFFFISDDDGTTWRQGEQSCSMPVTWSRSGLQEPGAIELASGVVWSWSRTDQGMQYEMFSLDGGDTWTPPAPSKFTSPASPLSMKRIPGSGHLLAVWNPIPNYQTRPIDHVTSWGRTPLVGAVSKDEGKTWEQFFAAELEEEQGGGYCYTAIHFVEDAFLLAYCAGEPEDGACLTRLKVRKINFTEMSSE